MRRDESPWETATTTQVPKARTSLVAIVVLVVVVGGCLAGTGVLAITAITAHRKTVSGQQLRQIVLALHNYHDTYRVLPPPYFTDRSGKPTKSWRACILPYLGGSRDPQPRVAHQAYDSTKPWDAPENRGARSMRVQVFESPLAGQTPGRTNYVVVVGPNTALPVIPIYKNYTADFSNMTDGTSTTIMVIEISNSDIEWAEPRDLDFNTLVFAESAPPGTKNVVVAGALVGMGDASVGFLDRKMTLAELKAYVTASGGERVAPLIRK